MWDPKDPLDLNVLYLRDYAESLSFIASNAGSPDHHDEFNDIVVILRPLVVGLKQLYDEVVKMGISSRP